LGEGPFNQVSIIGEACAQDSLTCTELKVRGNIKADRSLTCGAAKIVGTMAVNEDCAVQDAEILGEVRVGGDWKGDVVNVRGNLVIGGQCAAEKVTVRGGLDVKGLLNFDTADIVSGYRSSIHEMGGRKLRVRKQKGLWQWPGKTVVLKAQSIEADDIDIEHTHAEVVCGSRIRIGKKCRIGKVEYSESLTVENGAVVEVQKKIEK
jgi:cytoskeletal protein CcmA (bactofilin family)